jgi:hypothetical protein
MAGAVARMLLLAWLAGTGAAAAQAGTGPAAGPAPTPGQGRSTGSISGVVVDAGTGAPLARARVSLDGQKTRAHTNAYGRFVLPDQPAGPGVLEVSLVGFTLVRRDVVVPAAETLELTIPLAEGTGTYAEAVEVSAAPVVREPGVPSQISVGSAEIEELRSTVADDPFRAVQSLAGIGGSNDYRSDFSIRATPFDHLSVTLDGIPSSLLVHTVRHAQDTGSLAMVNSDILDGATVLFGSYPQRFGNRTGSQVDFRTREGSRAKPQFRVAVSAIAASAVAEGPIGRARRGSWLVTARQSYIDWVIHRIDRASNETFGFVDAQAKGVYDLSPRHTVTATLVAGRSRYEAHSGRSFLNGLEVGLNRSVLTGLTLRSAIGRSAVVTQQVYGVFNRFSNLNTSAQPVAVGTERDVSYRATGVVPGPRGTSLEAGVHVQGLHASIDETLYLRRITLRNGFADGRGRQGGYALARIPIGKALTVSPGARVDHFGATGETLASPWLQVELGLPGRFLVAGGTGLYRQSPDLFQIGVSRGDLRSERARHLDIGLGQEIGAWRWQLTAFDRQERGVLFYRNGEPRVADGMLAEDGDPFWDNALSGTIHGLEATIGRRTPNGLSGWIGYAYAHSRYDDAVLGLSFPSDVEQRHSLTAYGSYRVSDRTSVSARFRAATNTPIPGYYREIYGYTLLGDQRNVLRLADYLRLDFRANRTFDLPRGRLTLFLEVLNATSRRNQRAIEVPQVDAFGFVSNMTEKLLPIIPSAGFRIEF